MEKKYDGGPAYPVSAFVDPETSQVLEPPQEGMSLRDWLAGMIISAMYTRECPPSFNANAKIAYDQADAMIASREAK